MSNRNADRNLLVGILALQMDFIDRNQLIAAMHAWVLDKSKPLEEILLSQQAFDETTKSLLSAVVDKHLQIHGDVAQSLAAISSIGSLRDSLQSMRDQDIENSLAYVSPIEQPTDPYATQMASDADGGLKQRFQVLRPHAKGGLGEVFVACDCDFDREVALKEIQFQFADNPDSRLRFLREAEITGKLEHPGIVPVYGLGQYPDGRPYYAMRFIRGDSLQEAIWRYHQGGTPGNGHGESGADRAIEFRRLLNCFVSVCNTMEYAHSRGILHRDLKPANIMLGKYAETLVVDWGLAKTLGEEHEESGSDGSVIRVHSGSGSEPTRMGSRVGTPAYMSPEQAAGAIDKIGTASDVYGLGATLYCILTGRPPFDSRADSKKVEQGEFERPRELNRTVPPGLEAICLKAMAFRPDDRYRTPLELANDVEQWLADEPVSAWPEPPTLRLRRWISRHRTLVSTTAATFVVAAVGLTAFLYEQKESANHAAQAEKANAELAQSALDKREALARSEKEVDELIREGASSFGSGNLVDAKGYFDQAFGKADRLGLKDQIAHIQEQLGNINSLVAEQQAKAKDTERLAKLEELWRDAIFYSPSGPYELLVREQDSMKGLKRSRETAKEALALYYLTPESQKDGAFAAEFARHTAADQKKIQDRCYELLLILAEATARTVPPEENARDQAIEAIAVLDRVKFLPGSPTQAYYRQRGEYLQRSGHPLTGPSGKLELSKPLPSTAFDHFFEGKSKLLLSNSSTTGIDAARQHFDEAMNLQPNYFWAQFLTALCYLNDVRFTAADRAQFAKVHLMACAGDRPDFPGKFLLSGMIHSQLKDYDSAEKNFGKALDEYREEDDLQYATLINRALMRYSQQLPNEIVGCIEDLLAAQELLPSEFQAHKLLGHVYSDQGDFEQAIKQFGEAIEAINRFGKSIDKQGRLADLYRDLAWVQVRASNGSGAIESLDKAMELRDEDGDYIFKSAVLKSLGKDSEAAEVLKLSAEKTASLDDTFVLRARLLLLYGEDNEFLDLWNFKKGEAELNPNFYYGRALLSAKTRSYSAAIRDLDQALKLAPEHPLALQILTKKGWMFLAQDAWQPGLNEFEEALRRDKNYGDALLGRGLARAMLKQQGAIDDANNGLRNIAKKSGRAYYDAARVFVVFADSLAVNQRSQYMKRANELLEAAFNATPRKEKKSFDDLVRNDPLLKSIRRQFSQERR